MRRFQTSALLVLLVGLALVVAAEGRHGGPHASYRIGRHGWKLPDPAYTVGVPARPIPPRAALCQNDPEGRSYAERTRQVPRRVADLIYALYGRERTTHWIQVRDAKGRLTKHRAGCCEIDHLCALAHGCTNRDPDEPDDLRSYAAELWPQDWEEAAEKDKLETRLYRMICRGELTPAEAIHAITTDWTAAYDEYVLGRKP